MRHTQGGVLLGLMLSLPCGASDRFSLSVGNDIGGVDDVPLHWAQRDAQRFDALIGALGDVPRSQRMLLLGQRVGAIRQAIESIRNDIARARSAGRQPVLLVFYSGHGDAEALSLFGERLTLTELRAALDSIQAVTQLVVLDACHSGAMVRSAIKGLRPSPAFDVTVQRDVGPRGRVYITSSGAHEVAQESDDLESSFFGLAFLTALRGAADGDADGRVTLSEAYRFAYQQTLSASFSGTPSVQHPSMEQHLAGEGELVLTQLSQADASLELPASLSGDLLIVHEKTGVIAAEIHKAGGTPMKVALESDSYVLSLRRDGQVWASRVSLNWGGVQSVDEHAMKPVPLHAVLARDAGRQALVWSGELLGILGRAAVSTGDLNPALGLRVGVLVKNRFEFFTAFRFGLSAGLNDVYRFGQRQFELELGAALALCTGPLTWLPRLSVGAVLVNQTARRLDAEQVAMFAPEKVQFIRNSFGVGVTASLALRVPLFGRAHAVFEGGARLTTATEAGKQVARFGPMGLLGLGFSL